MIEENQYDLFLDKLSTIIIDLVTTDNIDDNKIIENRSLTIDSIEVA